MFKVVVPSPGESVLKVQLASWLVSDGDHVEMNQEIAEIDSDKATLSISAEVSGVITILLQAGSEAGVGDVIATIAETDTAAAPDSSAESSSNTASHPPSSFRESYSGANAANTENKLSYTPLARAIMEADDLSDQDVLDMIRGHKIKAADLKKLQEKSDKKDFVQQPVNNQ